MAAKSQVPSIRRKGGPPASTPEASDQPLAQARNRGEGRGEGRGAGRGETLPEPRPSATDPAPRLGTGRGTLAQDWVILPKRPPLGRVIPITVALLVALIVGAVTWAAMAPLQSAAVVSGEVVVESRSKEVRSLGAGQVGKVLVQDGDTVSAGDLLVLMDQTAARAKAEIVRAQLDAALARRARLMAEQRGQDTLRFPEALTARVDDPQVVAVLEGQRVLFRSRRAALDGKIETARQRIAELRENIGALEEQLASTTTQIALIDEEIAGVSTLLAEGLAPKTRLLALQRAKAGLRGELGQARRRLAGTQEQIATQELEIATLRNTFLESVASDLESAEQTVAKLVQDRIAAENALDQTEIRAPTTGTIVHLVPLSPGSVVAGGEALMDIVPTMDRVVVSVRIRPTDIDIVSPGQDARVMLLTYDPMTVPPVDGRVRRVGADLTEAKGEQEPYYAAEIVLTDDSLARLADQGIDLGQGMPAQAVILGGERTLLQYIGGPLLRGMMTALREE